MLSDMQQDTLRVAARHVATGRRIVARQCALIARLEEDGCSTVAAVQTLELFERTLAIFEDHYAVILKEIAEPEETQSWCGPPQRGFRRLSPR
jgi:hypothetical protein